MVTMARQKTMVAFQFSRMDQIDIPWQVKKNETYNIVCRNECSNENIFYFATYKAEKQ